MICTPVCEQANDAVDVVMINSYKNIDFYLSKQRLENKSNDLRVDIPAKMH